MRTCGKTKRAKRTCIYLFDTPPPRDHLFPTESFSLAASFPTPLRPDFARCQDLAFEHTFRHSADHTVDEFALVEHQEGRHAPDAELRSCQRVDVNIKFYDDRHLRKFLGKQGNNRFHNLARATPFSGKIDKYC